MSTKSSDAPSTSTRPPTSSNPQTPTSSTASSSTPSPNPTIIGIYGLPPSTPSQNEKKTEYRKRAIDKIRTQCAESGKTGAVAGHYMFWAEKKGPSYCCTKTDLNTYTHTCTWTRLLPCSVDHLGKWQHVEKGQLRDLCRKHGILFARLSRQEGVLGDVVRLVQDFQAHNEEHNTEVVEGVLHEVMENQFPNGPPASVLVIDGDRNFAPQDTGSLFWEKLVQVRRESAKECPLKELFGGPMGYSYAAFCQATLLYEEAVDDEVFDTVCRDVAHEVTMYPESVSLLHYIAGQDHVGAVIVLIREGLSDTVKVIGGGRVSNGYVVTPALTATIVSHLQRTSMGLTKVWAFGDSPLDIPMLKAADEAVVVVGAEETRSKTMDEALRVAVDENGLKARQVMPLVRITSPEFVDSLGFWPSKSDVRIFHATEKPTTKLLMTATRCVAFSGPILREAHLRIGWYIATEFLSELIGVEEYPIQHVQGNITIGYRLYHESQTLIVPLMRGGEPMAFGVNEAFPSSGFLHAKEAKDVKPEHVEGQITVVLVDCVINSGNSILEFGKRVRELHATVRIVIVAGVVQEGTLSEDPNSLKRRLSGYGRISLVALRVSQNKYTGRGGTATGNRLFNTTHLL
ncbi:hypothetical protein BU16DRAFT_592048 [Lophium mytilinum]|uniref:Phosphoribosyltransferase domain-containing protein n=1 Tax=Lophium mytilinum TaxID=390894 RepID=A0A6A6QRV8_9PEZI|nr:hypothetical protein BU16DRAFT_592048 [Lophium mytilinum]